MREQDDNIEGEDAPPSKSELKRQMLARQALGEALVALKDKQLARIPIEDERLMEAIRETRQIRSNSARRRHLQYIGKLMRDLDPAPIQRALDSLYETRQQANREFHQLEELRDEILADVNAIDKVLVRWPDADRQQLRQMALGHQREMKQGKPPATARKLFRYLRELQDLYGAD